MSNGDNSRQQRSRRVLVYRLGSLGDTCVALPALRVVRSRFPSAQITLLTNLPVNLKAAPAPAVLAGTGLINDYIGYTVATRNPWQLARLALRLRLGRYDTVVNLAEWRGMTALQRDAAFFKVATGASRVGFELELDHELQVDAAGVAEREAVRLLRRVARLGQIDVTDPRSFSMAVSAEELRQAEGIVRERGVSSAYVVFSVGTKAPANDWGDQNWWSLLAALMAESRRFGCVFVGSADERPRVEQLMRAWGGPKANLCGATSVRTSAAVMARAKAFVGHDSGPMHLAASVGTPCVALFSARNLPGKWFPLGEGHTVFYRAVECRGCGLTECLVERMRCLRGITVEEVAQAIREKLGAATSAGPRAEALERP